MIRVREKEREREREREDQFTLPLHRQPYANILKNHSPRAFMKTEVRGIKERFYRVYFSQKTSSPRTSTSFKL